MMSSIICGRWWHVKIVALNATEATGWPLLKTDNAVGYGPSQARHSHTDLRWAAQYSGQSDLTSGLVRM